MSVLLVGPSGTGKDSIINPTCNIIDVLGGKQIAGRTLEGIKECLAQMGDPAVGYINASELADFLGCKDYQAGIVQTLTDLLSGNKPEIDISLKSDILLGRPRKIYNPTLTMFAGSTSEWLQGMMPDGTMDGGFLPRFVVAAEWSKLEEGIRLVPNSGKYESREHRDRITNAKTAFLSHMEELRAKIATIPPSHGPIIMTETHGVDDADGWYHNWYCNRYPRFSPLLQAYASRAGGLMRRLAMLMAVSRGHLTFIEETDYIFADSIILHAAERLERAVIPQSKEVKVGYEILPLLPATQATLLRGLAAKHSSLWVKRALQYLEETEQIQMKEGKYIDSTRTANDKG